MSNDYARLMKEGGKLPPESKDKHGRLEQYQINDEDRRMVQVLASNAVSEEIMAKLLRIAKRTLNKYYRQEIIDGRALITARMGFALVKEGLAGNVAAQRYWLGTHGGPEWRMPKEDQLMPDVFDSQRPRATVHFYMPPNYRDQPEELDPPTIEGETVPEAA